jgi:hypothetical protein
MWRICSRARAAHRRRHVSALVEFQISALAAFRTERSQQVDEILEQRTVEESGELNP